jgi:hypothetical protein
MKERPILFSGPMVRAILEGRKTQTRRVMKLTDSGRVKEPGSARNWHLEDLNATQACPYGKPGDRLWVREAWAVEDRLDDKRPTSFSRWPTWFRADGSYYANTPQYGFHRDAARIGRWRPSIHMPRWASRISLEIVSVRVERLLEISAGDAIAEGIEPHEQLIGDSVYTTFRDYLTGAKDRAARQSFETLWESINGPDSLAENPWVWVVEFRPVEGGAR